MIAKEYDQMKLEYELLSYLDKQETPVGATTLVLVLDKKFGLSQASIGRKLMEFDTLGYTESVGRKGRFAYGCGQGAAHGAEPAACPTARQFQAA
ncbi:hypothetical protein HMSSN036_39800 [Paenibacillus macerans]|nr:hypothetical protein HMSSN036_39800 [Paenibacillus macerans]